MFGDLHIHTWHSDSTRSPAEVVALAKEKGIRLISICDHNIISAYSEIAPICKTEGIDLILGVEISASFEGKEYHILGYGFDATNIDITELLDYSNSIYIGSDDHGGFNNVIDGHEYYIGAVMVDTDKLNLKGIDIL